MSEGKRRVFSREFKLSAVQRVMAGESVLRRYRASWRFPAVICTNGAGISAAAE